MNQSTKDIGPLSPNWVPPSARNGPDPDVRALVVECLRLGVPVSVLINAQIDKLGKRGDALGNLPIALLEFVEQRAGEFGLSVDAYLQRLIEVDQRQNLLG